ncbi:hypothetical protein T11_555 [Trichinella zimbabwensis]|uniref:Uncharacterized protein n=1 Tax=Trichinella zimbabwensis TaxID=268475 RepID=A0A0V1H785_9BILA|nr:hypothetical protein T11_555 [Trichinella zimbabwensis]
MGNRIYRMSSSNSSASCRPDLLRVVLDLLRVVRVFTLSFHHCPYLSYILETQVLNSKHSFEASLAQPYRFTTPKKSYMPLVFF